jgi:tRNA/tmRNA/rRNA uracil-C5-methylase (TrmA/RlmC/RlmD family)
MSEPREDRVPRSHATALPGDTCTLRVMSRSRAAASARAWHGSPEHMKHDPERHHTHTMSHVHIQHSTATQRLTLERLLIRSVVDLGPGSVGNHCSARIENRYGLPGTCNRRQAC